MSGAVVVAIAAAIGNLLQGWDNATIAGLFPSSHIPPILSSHNILTKFFNYLQDLFYT